MMKIKLIIILLFISAALPAQTYRTRAISPEIYTILVKGNGEWDKQPIIIQNSGDFVNISFDRISEDSFNRLRYKILFCNADWTPNKELSDMEYLDGFNDNPIDDYAGSINTTVNYTHFNLDIPNRDINLKLSGNYLVVVYEEDNPDNILLTACFSVIDPKTSIMSQVSSVTDIDANKEHQQVAFSIQHQLQMRDPVTELKVFVRQNNRLDNQRTNFKPSMITPNKISYEHIRDLIFEAGNEYRRFETSTYRANGLNVAHIEYQRPYYLMDITTDNIKTGRSYSYDQDQNGQFIIRNRESDLGDTEADYFLIRFTLAMDEPIFQNIYINGDFTNNTFDEKYLMKYNNDTRSYNLTLLLKQGLYNYQYLAQMKGKYSTSAIEGNYYNTENRYDILVYYRPVGQRYDSLVGISALYSRKK